MGQFNWSTPAVPQRPPYTLGGRTCCPQILLENGTRSRHLPAGACPLSCASGRVVAAGANGTHSGGGNLLLRTAGITASARKFGSPIVLRGPEERGRSGHQEAAGRINADL